MGIVACQSPAPEANLTTPEDCITAFDPAVDYFPEKTTISHATGFSVTYASAYKTVTVQAPWQSASQAHRYILVPCGAPMPADTAGAQVIEVPVRRLVTSSTTHLPALEKLALLNQVVGHAGLQYVRSSVVLAQAESGALAEAGGDGGFNMEMVLDLAPTLVMDYEMEDGASAQHDRLEAAGIPVAINGEYLETDPLGRAEWLKFIALFFNKEAVAETLFSDIGTAYEALRELTTQVTERPTVISGSEFGGTWYMSGGASYFAQYLKAAQGHYLWAENTDKRTLMLDMESVFERGAEADFWISGSELKHINELVEADERYTQFKVFRERQIYFYGGAFFESALLEPHHVLADLIHIFHPNLLPSHNLRYIQRVQFDG